MVSSFNQNHANQPKSDLAEDSSARIGTVMLVLVGGVILGLVILIFTVRLGLSKDVSESHEADLNYRGLIPSGKMAGVPIGSWGTEVDANGLVHSSMGSSQSWVYPQIDSLHGTGLDGIKFAVQVEDTTQIDPDEAAQFIFRVLNDPRGWSQIDQVHFNLVPDMSAADMIISIASAATADEMCLPMATDRTWNCRNGRNVVLNADRWYYATPAYSSLQIEDYRAYMINHEVGHFLGRDHVECPGVGKSAPVMMQQSVDLQGCVVNPWPVWE